MPDAIFNMSRFLLTKVQNTQMSGISEFAIIYALVKQARTMGANKLVIQLLDRVKNMKVPDKYLPQVRMPFFICFFEDF